MVTYIKQITLSQFRIVREKNAAIKQKRMRVNFFILFKHILLINSKGLGSRQSLCRPSPNLISLV